MIINEKISQAIGLLNEFNIDCWLTFTRESDINGDPTLPFLAPGSVTWYSAFIICKDSDTRAIVGKYDAQAIKDTGAYRQVDDYVESIKEPLLKFLSAKNPRNIAVNYSRDSEICDGLTHGMYLTLIEYLTEINFADRVIPAEAIISALRQRKTKAELQWMKEAIRHTEKIFKKVAGFIVPGKSEAQIARFMINEMKQLGLTNAWDINTCPAVFSGPDTAAAHYNPTANIVKSGHVLNMDFGVKVHEYCSDLQRTFYILQPDEKKAPSDVQKGFNTIVTAIEEARKAMRPGVQGIVIDSLVRKIITDAGYEEYPHALGHQVGRFAHDGTALLGPAWEKYGKKPFIAIEVGMVFTLEPRLTVTGKGVVTIENMVVVTNDGAQYLSTPQTRLLLIKSGRQPKVKGRKKKLKHRK
jgi:Xaa-Pro aminopeptidase